MRYGGSNPRIGRFRTAISLFSFEFGKQFVYFAIRTALLYTRALVNFYESVSLPISLEQ